MSSSAVFTDPSQDGPVLAFNTGAVADGAAVMYPALPSISGTPSAWQVIEWSKNDYLNPTVMTVNSAAAADPAYGNALYSWVASDQLTSLNIYSSSGEKPYVYSLYEVGTDANPGGADLFLSSSVRSSAPVTFDHPVNFSLDAKLGEAVVSYNNATAQKTGAVLSQLLAGFTVWFNPTGASNYDPSLPTYSAFMQVELGSSGQTGPNEALQTYLKIDPSNGASITYTARLPGDPYLPFVASSGPPQALSYNLNSYLEDMVSRAQLPAAAHDLSRWVLLGMYVGIEANNGIGSDSNQGSVLTDLQVSNISVTTDKSSTITFSTPKSNQTTTAVVPPAASAAPTMPQIAYTDTTTSVSGTASEQTYQGTYTPLTYEYVAGTNDNMNFASPGNGLFLVTGSGNDGIIVSSGNNVIDAGGGSNFIKSGSGNDIVFEKLGSSSVWDTIINFHSGDSLGVWGFVPGQSTMSWGPVAMGAAGYQGLTLLITNEGVQSEVTFAGASTADIKSLAISTGTASAGSYLQITHI